MIPSSLFISSFRRIRKYGKPLRRLFVPVTMLTLLHVICGLLNYLYVDNVSTAWYRILWHNYYSEGQNIDNLYLGSSHVYCDINPAQLDYRNGQNNFNLSSPGQQLNGSYYLLREADRDHDLSHVYLELYYEPSTIERDYYAPEYLYRNWNNSDYMRPSVNKLAYMFTMSRPENYGEVFFPFVRYRSHLMDLGWVCDRIEEKREEAYQNYEYIQEDESGIERQLEKGYYYSTWELKEEQLLFCQHRILSEDLITPDAEKYLRKIIQYCRQKEIALTLFTSPIYELQLISTGDYDAYVNQIREIAEEYGLDYYDFNLCKEEYLPIQQREYFRDMMHLNNAGASLYTPFFWQVVSGTAEENEKYFYASYKEKLAGSSPEIFGLFYRDGAEGENLRYVQIASNRETGMEYRVIVTPDEGGKEASRISQKTGCSQCRLTSTAYAPWWRGCRRRPTRCRRWRSGIDMINNPNKKRSK